LSPFGIIVAAVIALAVVTTTVLTIDVGLMFDCCVCCIFGIIVAAIAVVAAAIVAAVVAVVLVAPATVAALAAFVITLSVVTTTVLTVDVGSIFDCCVPSQLDEDHCLVPSMPPPHSAEHEYLRTQLPEQGKRMLHCTWMWLGGRRWRRRWAKAAVKTGYSLFLDSE
jgi:hypothetical protein